MITTLGRKLWPTLSKIMSVKNVFLIEFLFFKYFLSSTTYVEEHPIIYIAQQSLNLIISRLCKLTRLPSTKNSISSKGVEHTQNFESTKQAESPAIKKTEWKHFLFTLSKYYAKKDKCLIVECGYGRSHLVITLFCSPE